jgi:ubiquitin carboxyl-terminal hydrolase 34
MQALDLVADLRAEISAWWEGKVAQERMASANEKPIVGGSTDGPLRIITQGQEITAEMDEKTLLEARFKDLQLCYVSQGALRGAFNRDEYDLTTF